MVFGENQLDGSGTELRGEGGAGGVELGFHHRKLAIHQGVAEDGRRHQNQQRHDQREFMPEMPLHNRETLH